MPVLKKSGLSLKEAHATSVLIMAALSVLSAYLYLSTGRLSLDEAAAFMKEAKTVHDRLEEKYIAAMDFEKVGEKTAEFLATL